MSRLDLWRLKTETGVLWSLASNGSRKDLVPSDRYCWRCCQQSTRIRSLTAAKEISGPTCVSCGPTCVLFRSQAHSTQSGLGRGLSISRDTASAQAQKSRHLTPHLSAPPGRNKKQDCFCLAKGTPVTVQAEPLGKDSHHLFAKFRAEEAFRNDSFVLVAKSMQKLIA